MQKIPKQEYTTEFKERTIKHVKEGKSIGLSAKELGLVEKTLRNWVKLSAAGKLTGAGIKPVELMERTVDRDGSEVRRCYCEAVAGIYRQASHAKINRRTFPDHSSI